MTHLSDRPNLLRRLALPRFMHSLRFKIAVGVALPVLVLTQTISLAHAWRERELIEQQLNFLQEQIASTLVGAFEHAMAANDADMLAGMLDQVTHTGAVERVQVVDLEGVVRADSASGVALADKPESACTACHAQPDAASARVVRLAVEDNFMRIAAPIPNQAACAECHPAQALHLGVLIADVSVAKLNEHLRDDLEFDLWLAAAISVALAIIVYLMLHRLIVRRVDRMQAIVASYGHGQFVGRMPSGPDELGELGSAFNDMARRLEQSAREQQERVKVRQRAIVEERERIARELHDGVAQLLAYVNTKAMAVRLLLRNRQLEQADRQLLQLEEAARSTIVDVREAILGLKLAGRSGSFIGALNEHALQFSRLSDLPVVLDIAPEVARCTLPAETELQLLRIVQEALTNIRKHAAATQAVIRLRVADRQLELTIRDDGQGFAPDNPPTGATFGLTTMRERAESIGASYQIISEPGAGTALLVQLPLKE